MVSLERMLRGVAAAHAAGLPAWNGDDIAVRRVGGGSNNALYRVQVAGEAYACKLCVADERRRAAREYSSMRLLASAQADVAPEPVTLDESCTRVPFPVVIYRWLPGGPLTPPLTEQQLQALLDSYHRLHSVHQEKHGEGEIPEAWFHWFDFEPYRAELHWFVDEYGNWLATTQPDGAALHRRLLRLVEACSRALSSTKVNPDRDSVPLRLCRVDPNLANTVWGQDGTLRWVDWEYSGYGDPALDLTELHWHAALEDLDPRQHAWLRENYRRPADDPGFEERLAIWDLLLAARWPLLVLRVLWSAFNGPDRERLSSVDENPAHLRARMVRFIERAEGFFEL